MLDVASDLVGRPVFAPGSSQGLGVVTDALINLRDGRLAGLALLTQNGIERVVLAQHLQIGAERVSIIKDRTTFTGGDDPAVDGILALRELWGANVVTDEGRLLGRVCQIELAPNDGRVFYEIAETPLLRRLFRKVFAIEGSVARSYSRVGSRLIVHIPHESSGGRGRHGDSAKNRIGWRRTEWVVHTFLSRYGFIIWLAILIGVLVVLLLWL